MSTQETEAENDANDNIVPNESSAESPPRTLTRTNTEDALNEAFSLYLRSSQCLDDKGKSSSALVSQNPIPKCSSLETVITVPDNGDDEELNQVLPTAEPQREPSIPFGYPPSFFQQGFYSSPEPSNPPLGYGDPEVTIESLNLPAHDTDLERVDAQASGNDTGHLMINAVEQSTFTTPLSVTSTLYAHDLVNPQDKGKGNADPLDHDTKNGSPSPSLNEADYDRGLSCQVSSRSSNFADLEIAAGWKMGEIARMQLGEAGPSRMPYTSQAEDEEGMSDLEELDDRQPSKRKRSDDDEFAASSDEEYSKSQDSDWSLSKSLSPPPVKCGKAPKRKFNDSSSDENEQPTRRKRSKKEVHPSPRRAKYFRGKKIEEEDYVDSEESISSPRIVAGPSKSSLGKRKRKPTRDEAPLVQRKRARRIRESSDDDDYSSAAENITSQVKTSRKKNKSKKTTAVKPSETHSSNPRGPRVPCPEEGCEKSFPQTDLKRHVRTHTPSKCTIQWLQAHDEDLSKGFLAWYGCPVPRCSRRFSRYDSLKRHYKNDHKSRNEKDMQAILFYVDVTRFMVQE